MKSPVELEPATSPSAAPSEPTELLSITLLLPVPPVLLLLPVSLLSVLTLPPSPLLLSSMLVWPAVELLGDSEWAPVELRGPD